MSKTQQTDQFDNDLKGELFDFATAADGEVVTAEIVSVEKESRRSGEKILVTARLPTGKTFRERMPYPKGDTNDWKFVRLARSCGYSLGSAEHMIGDEVKCRYTDDDWKILAPQSLRTTALSGLKNAFGGVTVPLWMVVGLYQTVRNDEITSEPIEYAVESGIVLFAWVVAFFVAVFIAAGIEYTLSAVGFLPPI